MIYLLWPLAFLPQRLTHLLGRLLGRMLYIVIPKWRKRTLSNLALASKLNLSDAQIPRLAHRAFENLGITALEYPKLLFRRHFLPAVCENPEKAAELLKSHRGVIFFCGHQANWELLFLEGTKRMPGTAIGRPIKQHSLYRHVVAMREKYGGRIIAPKEAVKEGMRALRSGRFLGIVGDQGMPESSFSSEFLGRPAYTTTAPALLSLKLGVPLIVATIARIGFHYKITYSEPIQGETVDEVMQKALAYFEKSIIAYPDQWLWMHNRWKQETPLHVLYRFRHESILILIDRYAPFLDIFKEIYPRAFITVITQEPFSSPHFNVIVAQNEGDYYTSPFLHKLIFNFTEHKVASHYKKGAAFDVLDRNRLTKLAELNKALPPQTPWEEKIKIAIGRKGVLWS